MILNDFDNIHETINRSLLMMKYDNNKTLSENTMMIKEQDTFKPEQTFGKCLNKLTFTPHSVGTYNNTDSVSKKLTKWAKSIGESFSYQLYQKSGWNSKKFDNNFTKCDGYRLSINSSFKKDLDRYIKDFPSLPNSPYFCYNQNAVQNRWNPPMDTDLKTPNYVNELTNTFGTLDTCTIFGMLENLPKFDWEKADKEDWENVLIGLSVASMAVPQIGIFMSLAADLSLAALYYSQGKNYDAGLTLAFGLIPFGQILNKIPGVKQLGEKGFKKLLKKVINAEKGTKYEKLIQAEKDVLKEMERNNTWAIKRASQIARNLLILRLSKLLTLETFLKYVYKFIKYNHKNPFKSILIQIGSVWYSFDKLADIYGIKNIETKDPKTIEKLSSEVTPENFEETLKDIDLQMDDKEFDSFLSDMKKDLEK
jgi:hypothetical protein